MAIPAEADFKALILERARLRKADEEYNLYMAKEVAALKKQVEDMRAEQRKRPFIWDERSARFVENSGYVSPDPVLAGAVVVNTSEPKVLEGDVKMESLTKSDDPETDMAANESPLVRKWLSQQSSLTTRPGKDVASEKTHKPARSDNVPKTPEPTFRESAIPGAKFPANSTLSTTKAAGLHTSDSVAFQADQLQRQLNMSIDRSETRKANPQPANNDVDKITTHANTQSSTNDTMCKEINNDKSTICPKKVDEHTTTKEIDTDTTSPKKANEHITDKVTEKNTNKSKSTTIKKLKKAERKVPPKCFPDIMHPRQPAMPKPSQAKELDVFSSKLGIKRKRPGSKVVHDSDMDDESLDLDDPLGRASKQFKHTTPESEGHVSDEEGVIDPRSLNESKTLEHVQTLNESHKSHDHAKRDSPEEPGDTAKKSDVSHKSPDISSIRGRMMASITPEDAANATVSDLLSLVDLRIPAANPEDTDRLVSPASILPSKACLLLATNMRDLLTPSISEKKSGSQTMRPVAGKISICLKSRKLNRTGHRAHEKRACKHCAKSSRGSFCVQMEHLSQRPYVASLPEADRVGLSENDPSYWVKMSGLSA